MKPRYEINLMESGCKRKQNGKSRMDSSMQNRRERETDPKRAAHCKEGHSRFQLSSHRHKNGIPHKLQSLALPHLPLVIQRRVDEVMTSTVMNENQNNLLQGSTSFKTLHA